MHVRTVFDDDIPSVREQILLFSSHGVVVCPHGAGLMNLLMMPAFYAVVEIFTHNTHHSLYQALAALMGVAHYPVHTPNGAPMWAQEKVRG